MTARFDASTIDQRIVMYGKTWADFEAQIALRGEDCRSPKLAFLDGAIELMSPSHGHEDTSRSLVLLLGFYGAEIDVAAHATGAWLLKRKPDAGAEPDESFVFGPPRPPDHPDLVIEVVWTHGTLDKLEIYRRFGISEVWWWEDDGITAYQLGPDGYIAAPRSRLMPDLDLVELAAMASEMTRESWSFREVQTRVRERLIRR